jgi:hypothetical protein
MPSISLLLALAAGQTEKVPAVYARAACDWCEYLESHARRIYSARSKPEIAAASVLAKRMEAGQVGRNGSLTVREIQRKQWTCLDTPDAVRAALAVLEEYGWVRRVQLSEPRVVGRPSEMYLCNPKIGGNHAGK